MTFKKDISIRGILLNAGYIVTDRCFGGWDRGKRMIMDMDGNEVGYFTPLSALDVLCGIKV